MHIKYRSNSEAATMELGFRLGQLIPAGTVIALIGDLGVGKTHFVQGFARGLGIEDAISSPTFTLVAEYRDPAARLALFHMDAYRLETGEQFIDSGLDEYFTYGGVTIIEWADLIIDALPPDVLTISFFRENTPWLTELDLEQGGQIEIPADDGVRILDFIFTESAALRETAGALQKGLSEVPIDELKEETV